MFFIFLFFLRDDTELTTAAEKQILCYFLVIWESTATRSRPKLAAGTTQGEKYSSEGVSNIKGEGEYEINGNKGG